MGRQIVLSAHNLILFSNKQFQTSDTYGMDKSKKKWCLVQEPEQST